MPAGFGPRFPFEAGFLILVAVAAYFAELSTLWTILAVALGWVVVALVEWLAWREEPAYPPETTPYGWMAYGGTPPPAWPEEALERALPDIVVPPPPEDLTSVLRTEVANAGEHDESDEPAEKGADEHTLAGVPSPAAEAPRRRWLRRRGADRETDLRTTREDADDAREEER